jgi:hypothetical protein
MSNFPGKSIKLIRVGQSLSKAFLKHGWVESGWLVALFATVLEVVYEKDLIVLLPTVDLVATESV